MVVLAFVVVVTSCLRLASSQFSVADWSLPGFTKWQADLRNHARTQGRPHDLNNLPQVEERSDSHAQANGWQQMGHPKGTENIHALRTQSRTDHSNEKLQTILGRGNKMHTIIEKLLKRSQHKKRETLSTKNAKSIISEQLRTNSGLSEIIKQVIRNKLNRLQIEAHEEKSPVQILLAQSGREETFLDNTVGRSESFLDRLIKVMKDEDAQLQNNRKPKELSFRSKTSKSIAEENPLHFFKDVGLIRENQQDITESDPKDNEVEDEKLNALKFLSDTGLLRKKPESTTDVNKNIKEGNNQPDITNSFLEEEIDAAETETEFLADEIAGLLVQLEADLTAEDRMMVKSHDIIQSKINRFPMQMLLKDKDFIDSVFFRFALMRLPLRTKDIDVSEAFQINKVLQKSMAEASVETRSLLKELRNDAFDEDDGRDRASAIDESRRQLQKLLKIMAKKI